MSTGKRIGWMGMSFLTLLAALSVQSVGSVMVMLPYAVMESVRMEMIGQDVASVADNLMGKLGGIMGIILVVVGVLLLAVFLPWFYFGCGRPKVTKDCVKRVFAPKTLLVVVVVSVGLNYGINCLLQLIYIVAPQSLENYQQLMENAGIGTDVWANAAAVLLAPLGEELIFRGVAFYYARKAMSCMGNARVEFWIANCFQAFLFGIYHMNLVQGIYAFLIGLALGYLCQRYHSVIPGMLAHLVFNSMSALFGDMLYSWIPDRAVWYALIGVMSLMLVLFTMIVNGNYIADNEQNIA